jgi:hypothetical protein
MSINSNQIIKKPDVVIDPQFFLPPGVNDARYPSAEELEIKDVPEVVDDDDTEITGEVTFVEPEETSDAQTQTDSLTAPDSITIISQTIRTAENGQHVVDIIIDVEDVDSSIQIDVRIAKA